MISPNQFVIVDGANTGVVEKSVGSGEHIVRLSDGRRVVCNEKNLRVSEGAMRAASVTNPTVVEEELEIEVTLDDD